MKYGDILQDQVQLEVQSFTMKFPYSQMLVHP